MNILFSSLFNRLFSSPFKSLLTSPAFARRAGNFCLKMPAVASGYRIDKIFQRYLVLLLCGLIGSFSFSAFAQLPTPLLPLPPPELALRLKKLESELRCLVCQNQTLAESPAGLAGDLRREVRTLIESGKSDEEIKSFLQVRYGDYVLYRPPVNKKTWLLWFGPFAMLVAGGFIFWWVGRRRRLAAAVAPVILNDAAKRQIENARRMLGD
jgi:cytochrome c-type biogenesis protein CcmH